MKSPIVYYKDNYFYDIAEQLSKEYFSPISSIYHYLHMANGNFRHYLQAADVKLKKYFYVLRPLLACMWIEKYHEAPPVEFDALLTQITEKELLEKIAVLLAKKKSGVELGIGSQEIIINDFIAKTIQHFESIAHTFDPRKKPNRALLEDGFIKILEYAEKNKEWFIAYALKECYIINNEQRV
jgi:predicted nucleotidyltransferase